MFALLCEVQRTAERLTHCSAVVGSQVRAAFFLGSQSNKATSSAPTSSAESPEHLAEPDCSHRAGESFALSNENIQGKNVTKQYFLSYLADCLCKTLPGFVCKLPVYFQFRQH